MKRFMMFAAVCMAAVSLAFAADKASIGKPAPAFQLQDQNGKTVTLAEQKGKIVVLEWFNNDCPFVVRHYEKDKTMSTLSDKYSSKDVVWIAINSTSGKSGEDNKKIGESWSIKYPLLSDADGAVGKEYGAKTTPHMFIIDKDGNLAYAGGIDNDPDGKLGDKRVNYVEKALDELLAGKPVSEPETKQYGCGVKYAK